VVGGVSSSREESNAVMEELKDKINAPNPTGQGNIPIPNVQPLAYMPDMPAPSFNDVPSQSMSLRERVKQNPALASTLLGGLGNAGLL
jgi:hypothetical protein